MAYTTCKDNVFHILGFLCLLLLIQKNNAAEFKVGDQKGWTVPDNTSSNSSLNAWAERNRFQKGDSLVFDYDASQDAVVQVTKEGYENCTAENPLATFNDGHTVFKINQYGAHYYFISGNRDHCQKNEKMEVRVLADRSTNATASPPSPGSSDMVPAPTPSSDESPPAGTVEINPTPPPTGPPPNSASSMFMSFFGSMGAFFASSLVLAI
ncbi:PREDICTED: early nodulin-like protein 1 [Populus euphratica]|uniref:Early nodulin-like protein 1 n=1 Tax=Populus euphratica TaxID=75702 RepID=A0AAJ6UJV7_POPEU|nr:PREDICTED: early nodulin-like protein 1 [Populus euphratica]